MSGKTSGANNLDKVDEGGFIRQNGGEDIKKDVDTRNGILRDVRNFKVCVDGEGVGIILTTFTRSIVGSRTVRGSGGSPSISLLRQDVDIIEGLDGVDSFEGDVTDNVLKVIHF